MSRCGQKGAADYSGPERVAARNLKREVEELEFAKLSADSHDFPKSAVNQVEQDQPRYDSSKVVNEKLNHFNPDDRRYPTEIGKRDHHQSDYQNRLPVGPTSEHRKGNRRRVDAHAIRQGAGDNKQRSGYSLDPSPESLVQDLIHGKELALEVERDEQRDDYQPPDQIAHDQLQEGEVAALAS